ncbi:MAG: CHAT domain-containing protein [Pseudomonadota bacterium]
MFLLVAQPVVAAETSATAARALFADGRTVSARRLLEPLAEAPDAPDRLATLLALVEICERGFDPGCVARYGPLAAQAAEAAAAANPLQRAELKREAEYHLALARRASGASLAGVLDSSAWSKENAYNGDLYLRRQLLIAGIRRDLGQTTAVDGAVDRIVSLLASVDRPEAAQATLARASADVLAILVERGQVERAWGMYRAAGPALSRLLPAGSADAVAYRLTEAGLLQRMGDMKGAAAALDSALATLRVIELEAAAHRRLMVSALNQRAAVCVTTGDLDCARAALAEHPDAALHREAGRAPANPDEVVFLLLRRLAAVGSGADDPIAAQALARPPGFRADPAMSGRVAMYREAGAALAPEAGPARDKAAAALGRALRQVAWARPDALEHLLLTLALGRIDGAGGPDDEAAFTLMQIAGRGAHSFDAEALTQLSMARDEMGRRAAHQALRLRARRDRLEREQLQKVLGQAAARTPAPGLLTHDPETRLLIRDFDLRIARADVEAAKAGVRREAGPVPIARLQAVLAADEAVLAMAPTSGGFAYMCVRRDAVARRVVAADPQRVRIDTRLVQSALTATHAPSERLDIQFPAEAAVRLYDVMIRPFDGCLKPGDRIVWLSGVAGSVVPLSALPAVAPPRIAGGYDLGAADWIVRRHAVSYAGSAGAILAARSSRSGATDFDFLGVGDPVLRPRDGEDPAKALLRGTRLDGLAPLPETRDELEASAKGFRASKLLLQDGATERALRSQMVGAYRYLSFATHGLIREDLQGLAEPALVLTPVDAGDPIDDGLLTASEIADLNLQAAFVALSACNTANFDLTQFAQDLPALASAFAVAGVPSTLATLWPVNSEAGKRVVADVFGSLRDVAGAGPAEALAQAQRRLLAAPPERAYLHPRFWAPFVVLGDGAAAAAPVAPAKTLRSVEVLTRSGGEVLDVERTSRGTATQFISDADARGQQGAAVRLADDGGEARRHDDRSIGASRFGVQMGERRLVGGYGRGALGRYVPVVRAYEDGAIVAAWQGEGLSRVDAFILGGASTGADRAVVAVGEVNLRDTPDADGGRLHLLELTASLEARPLFTIDAPPGFSPSDATVTPLGQDLAITYSTSRASPLNPPATPDDDYDAPTCLTERVTWLELRDGRTGARKAMREIRGLTVVAARASGDGAVLLGGSVRQACGQEGRATVVSIDARLQPRTLYRDDSLGASEVRVLAGLSAGGTFVAASKENVVTYRRPDVTGAAGADPFAVAPFTSTYSGLLVTLDARGAASRPRLLDSSSNIYVTAADASRRDDILLGGSLAGQAAIFHLSEAPQ